MRVAEPRENASFVGEARRALLSLIRRAALTPEDLIGQAGDVHRQVVAGVDHGEAARADGPIDAVAPLQHESLHRRGHRRRHRSAGPFARLISRVKDQGAGGARAEYLAPSRRGSSARGRSTPTDARTLQGPRISDPLRCRLAKTPGRHPPGRRSPACQGLLDGSRREGMASWPSKRPAGSRESGAMRTRGIGVGGRAHAGRRACSLLGVFAFLSLASCSRSAPTAASENAAAAETPDAPLHGTSAGIEWIEIVTGGARPSDPLPMIVGAHGLGGRPADFLKVFDDFNARTRIVLVQGLMPYHDGFAWWVPGNGDGLDGEATAKGIAAAADQLALALAALVHERPTIGAPVLTGFSQGGALSFAVAVRHPEAIVAAYPMSGWLPPALRSPSATASARPPILAFHGTADGRVPIAESRETVAALVAAGYRAELRQFDGMDHAMSREERGELYRRIEANLRAAEPR